MQHLPMGLYNNNCNNKTWLIATGLLNANECTVT